MRLLLSGKRKKGLFEITQILLGSGTACSDWAGEQRFQEFLWGEGGRALEGASPICWAAAGLRGVYLTLWVFHWEAWPGLYTQGAWLAGKIPWLMTLCACVCTRVPMCGCMCVCMFMPGEGLWVNWCVAGTGTSGPSPLSRAGRNQGGKEGIETHHEIRAMAERNPLRPEGDLASRSGRAPSPSSHGFPDGACRALAASQLLPCPASNKPVVLGFVGSSSDLPSVPQVAAGLPLPPPLAWW